MRAYTLTRLPSGLLMTRAALHGPAGAAAVRLIVDTGAVYTVIHPKPLERIGISASGETSVRALERTLRLPALTIDRLSVFGSSFNQYRVLAYAPAAFTPGIDGVLSIDLLHALAARLDFATGVLTIP